MPFFTNLLTEGGPIMPLILVCAAAGYCLACERLLVWAGWYWRDRFAYRAADAAALATAVERPGSRGAETPLTALLREALALSLQPPERREAALTAALMARMPKVEARISTIGWLGTILPLLGLLGTVSGMTTTFQDLAVTTSRQVLSHGLSEALWTTEVGLIGALPLLAAHHLLGRLKARWLNNLERALALLQSAPPSPGKTDEP